MSEPEKKQHRKRKEDPTLVRDEESCEENVQHGSDDTTVSRTAPNGDEESPEEGEPQDEAQHTREQDDFHARIADDPTAINLDLRRRMLEESATGQGGTEEIPEFSDDSTTLLGVTLEDLQDLEDVEDDGPCDELDDAATTEVGSVDAGSDAAVGDDDTTLLASEYSRTRAQTELAKTIQRPGAAAGTVGFTETEHLLGGRGGILKGRFVLEERIGAGGMGTVYKARDLRKVEARDRNPYVAVKVLNDDFKKHPDAFIALQREAAKSQALSHPNIVRIYDFDKDGDTPFMTMEMLEGAELAELLRDASDGLPREQAWKILRGICAGLQRAHEANITHSDFKPGNVYVSHDNVAKILDFGIARAVHGTAADSEGGREGHAAVGDKTLFDPGTLGALTPAYASLEMLNGEQPDPRDDIYGLALVAYLIFTGKHPFDRKPADEAREERLKPKRIRGLSGRQWRAIERGLQFERSERIGSVEEFSALLFDKPRWAVRPVVAAAAVFAMVLVMAGSMMLENAAQGNRDVIAQQAVLNARLADIDALLAQNLFDVRFEDQLFLEVQQLRSILAPDDPRVDSINTKVLGRYLRQVRFLRDDFDAARAVLDRARRYTANGEPFSQGEAIVAVALQERINALFASAAFTPAWEQRVLLELSRAREYLDDASWVRDANKRAVELYRVQATRAIGDGQLDVAQRMIEGGQRYGDASSFAEQISALAAAQEQQRWKEEQQRRAEEQRRKQEEQHRQELLARQKAAQRDEEFRQALVPLSEALQCGAGLSMRRVAGLVADLRAEFAERFAKQEGKVTSSIAACIAELKESNAEKARSVSHAAQQIFPDSRVLATIRFDPCGARYLVGHGNSAGRGGYCEDALASGGTGPRLVVVPANGEMHGFAIGKYEVSIAELNVFCGHSDKCTPLASDDDRLPATGVGIDVARDYLRWLSEESGYRYRLPTVAEWRYAAAAEGGDPDPNRNCSLNVPGIRKGDALQSVRNGQGNAWGLVNHLGNAQEWAMDGSSVVMALGGAHVDTMGDCIATLARAHSGAPDSITGFRVLRELR